jgi:Domain of unknown function (DUF7008)/Eco57I restriction-modification methylase
VTATASLTADLQRQVLTLEDDLRTRVEADAELLDRWHAEHARATETERTASSWTAWRDDRVTQAAVAWVLTSVFIRFCEDNALVSPVWIAGPEHRRREALDAQLAFFRAHPEDTDREWLLSAVDYLRTLPATKGLVDDHSALHLVSPSGNAVTDLLAFWRRRGEDGTLVHDLADPLLSTRFLGDLYQDLSKYAKDTYALLQTPEFVEEFILDRTLKPALAERPLDGFRLIDPTCGSGHFLLGAFARLLDSWDRRFPDLDRQSRVQAALDAVHGVDLNPFAVAIARFRLTVAALQACGLTSLEAAPAFQYHLAVGDSLIHGPDTGTLQGFEDRTAFMPFTYTTEDSALLLTLLEEGRYDVVVGNPPYITVKDKALNKIYRKKYADVCKGTYALTVPFMKQFFALAKDGDRPGWVGQITSNSFMKREFGAPLIERFLANVDLRYIIDSEGAWIPGHNMNGTPTVILIALHRPPMTPSVRAVLSKGKRETREHSDGKGPYWSAIVEHIDDDWDDDWITVADVDRSLLATHPWFLAGGGAIELIATVESSAARKLGTVISGKVGFASFPGADDAFLAKRQSLCRYGVPQELARPVITGDVVRDWHVDDGAWAFTPYDEKAQLVPLEKRGWGRRQWPMRTILGAITGFEGQTRADAKDPWWGWYRWVPSRYVTPLSIAYAEVATHNHFALDRGGKVFNQTAPVIKLPKTTAERDHLALLGVLNSSTACFWLRMMSKPKGGAADALWARTHQFNGATVQDFPLPSVLPMKRGHVLGGLAQALDGVALSAVCAERMPSAKRLTAAREEVERIQAQMIAVQEELDWECYRLYGLVEDDLTYPGDDLPGLTLGERAFEIALARKVKAGEEETAWFSRHGSTPITEIPEQWPEAYRDLAQRRLELIASDPNIRLLERPEYKRRWASEPWEKRQERAVRGWLLDRLEDRRFWFDAHDRPIPRSISQLADDVARDPDLVSVLALWEGRPDVPLTQSLTRLLADEAVPFLAAYRYKDSGLRKRTEWEHTWALQRREDAGEQVGTIPVPPKYTSADFRKQSYWQHRGKLDVPKERFVGYPDAGRRTDPTPVLGWTGWDHAQQSLVLAQLIGWREADGWTDERLVPLVAGLAELQPWVDQWHAEINPTYGVSLAAFCREQLTSRAAQVGKTLAELAAWRPTPAARGRRPAKASRPSQTTLL